MANDFRTGEIMNFESGNRRKKENSDQLEKDFTTGEIMPKDRYLGKKKGEKDGEEKK